MKRLGLLLVLCHCADPPATRIVPASALVWAPVQRGLESVDVWGNARHGAHGTLTRFAPDLTEPMHAHSHAFRALVLAGTMRYVIAGAPSAELAMGSYIVIAPGTAHFAHCLGPVPCVVYVEQDGALDVLPR